MTTPETPDGETSFVAIKQTMEPFGETKYKMKFAGSETLNVSNFTIRKDRTIPILFVGGVIFMIGVAIGSYWNHRRLWLQVEPDGGVVMAAHVNKNMFSMKKRFRCRDCLCWSTALYRSVREVRGRRRVHGWWH